VGAAAGVLQLIAAKAVTARNASFMAFSATE